jgi:hypothetical protein
MKFQFPEKLAAAYEFVLPSDILRKKNEMISKMDWIVNLDYLVLILSL